VPVLITDAELQVREEGGFVGLLLNGESINYAAMARKIVLVDEMGMALGALLAHFFPHNETIQQIRAIQKRTPRV
jgi:hypothetical protein